MSRYAKIQYLRAKFANYLSPNLSKKKSLTLILIFTFIIVIDSTIVKFLAYSRVEFSTTANMVIFVGLSIVYAIGGILLINSVSKYNSKYAYKSPLKLKYFHAVMIGTQISIIGIIITILVEMFLSNRYSLYLLQGSSYLTHFSALIFTALLVFLFIGWLKSRRKYMIVLYIVSFVLISANIILSLVYLETQFYLKTLPYIRSYPVHNIVIALSVTPLTELLASIFDILSLSSFLAIWISTIFLLYQYRYKVGRIRYFLLTGIPLVYYIIPFQDYFGSLFSPLILNSPIAFGVIYVLIFSATKQIGALLFSLAFWTASSFVTNERVRYSLLTSAIGMALLFGSIEIVTLQYKVYPPFGLVTEAFIPLGSYLLFIGIFTSAIGVSRDAQLRREFYKAAQSQLSLLKTIGVIQMEREFEKKFKTVEKRTRLLETTEEPYVEEDVKSIMHDVLNELYSKDNDHK